MVVPSHRLKEETRKMADIIASNGPLSIRLQKELVNCWMQGDLNSAIEAGINSFAYCFTSGQPQEGVAAFLDKRAPRW
jgi:enoyl-CoA hydratase/carnithine racemase